jgi:hypothetical protein
MRSNESNLRIVEHLAVIADEGIERRVLPAPRVAEPLAVGVMADLDREGIDNRVLLVAPIAFHNHITGVDGGSGRIRRIVAIIEVPTCEGVEAYKHSRHSNWPANRSEQPIRVEAMNVHVVKRHIGGPIIGQDATPCVVVKRLTCITRSRVPWSYSGDTGPVVRRDAINMNNSNHEIL